MPLMALIEHVYWNGISLYWQMDNVGIPIPRYLAEVERLLHLGTHSVIPRNQNALSLGGKIFGAHLLNAFGLATIDVVRYLEGVRPGLLYSWEPAAAVPAARPASDVADDVDEESTELYDLGQALQGDPPRAPPPPPPASNWEAIVQLVRISRGPRGKRSIRDKMGHIVKCADTDRELHLHVLNHIPDWRTRLGLQ